MPQSKSNHKKTTGNRLKKWLYKARVGLNLQKPRFKKAPSDIVFLTTKEVKASLAQSTEQKPANVSVDTSSRPDPGILPKKNRSRAKSRDEISIRSKLKRFLHRLSLGVSKKKHSSSLHHQRKRIRIPDEVKPEDIKSREINELKATSGDHSLKHQAPNQGHRQHHHRHHEHKSRLRKWKRSLMQRLHLNVKKSGFSLAVSNETTENATGTHDKKIPWIDYIKPALTSTAMFLVAYQLSWFFYQLSVMITASFFKIDSVLYYYEVMFPEGSDSPKWSPEKIIIITLAGPLLALVTWMILRLILKIKGRYGSHMRMFMVWMYLISMMLFFGAFVGGAITLEGFGYVIDWLFMSIALRLILSLVFISMIIALSWNLVSFMPETSRSSSWKNNRYNYVISRLIVPWLLGTAIMTMLKITKNITQHENIFDYDIINLATLVFAVVPPLFNSMNHPQLNRRRKVNQRLKAELPVLWIAGAIVIVILFRIVLSYGVYFRLVFDLDINFYK